MLKSAARRSWTVLVPAALAAALASGALAQGGAKALFHAPPGSTGNPSGPVGIYYWFENDQGMRFSRARETGVGVRVRLPVQSNTSGFLTVWMIDGSDEGRELTPMDGQWHGYPLEGRRDYVVPAEIPVSAQGSGARILILFARSQTEQVRSAKDAREKIRRLSNALARDGALAIAQETDTSTSGQVGTYIVQRAGLQPGVEFEIGR